MAISYIDSIERIPNSNPEFYTLRVNYVYANEPLYLTVNCPRKMSLRVGEDFAVLEYEREVARMRGEPFDD